MQHTCSPTPGFAEAGGLCESGNIQDDVFFPNWVEAGLYVLKLCLSLTVGPLGMLLNWVLHRLVLCTEFCNWQLLFVTYDCTVAHKSAALKPT